MKCGLLHIGNNIVCAAGNAPYVPSDFETMEYCLADRHRKCPFYCMTMADGMFNLKSLDLQAQSKGL